MTRPMPTPGPYRVHHGFHPDLLEVESDAGNVCYEAYPHDAAFIVAACNALLTAAEKLRVHPTDLAEALADGGIEELYEIVSDCAPPCSPCGTCIACRIDRLPKLEAK